MFSSTQAVDEESSADDALRLHHYRGAQDPFTRDERDTTKREDKASCCTDAELGAARASLARHTEMVPLCRMEYEQQPGGTWEWSETNPLPSTVIDVQLAVHISSYKQLGRAPPRSRQGGM